MQHLGSRSLKLLVGQSGGPTAVINASLAGVISEAQARGCELYGMRYGIEGFLSGTPLNLSELFASEADISRLKHTPASYLGSCRFKLPELPSVGVASVYDEFFDAFDRLDIDGVLYIGGNDSMDTISKLGRFGKACGSTISFIGIPKTIDNDLVLIDHTPGYGSAARFVNTSLMELALDGDVYDLQSATFVEIMGRDAGWLAASSVLAHPDIILLPEVPIDMSVLIGRIKECFAQKNTVMVAVSEGLRTKSGKLLLEEVSSAPVATDTFGHVATLSGVSRYLAAAVKDKLGCKTRAVELSTLQRAAAHLASSVDRKEAFELGKKGVELACAGESLKMCSLTRLSSFPYRTQLNAVDVCKVANKVRDFPLEWIDQDKLSVTEDMVEYIQPLVSDLPSYCRKKM